MVHWHAAFLDALLREAFTLGIISIGIFVFGTNWTDAFWCNLVKKKKGDISSTV